jgi:hypothetical protein
MRTAAKVARRCRAWFGVGLLGAALTLAFALAGEAADHRDGPIFPNTALNGRPDINDVYIFRSPADPQPPNPDAPNFGNTVLCVTFCPFPGVLTPTSADPRVTLDLNVVNVTGHLTPDMTFRFTFAPPTAAAGTFNQVVTLRLIQGATTTTIAHYTYAGNQVIPPAAFANNVTFPGDAIATGKFIAGNFDDPFFFDSQGAGDFLKDGNATIHPFPRPRPANPAKPRPNEAKNFFAGANTLAVLLEVPTTKLTTANPPLLGVWATTAVNGTQVDRMGRAGINTVLIPPVPRNNLARGERRTAFNLGSPATDVANFRADMQSILTAVFGNTQARATALTDSALGATIIGANTGLLPDVLTVDLSKQYLAAGNGYFNGRRFRDDTINISLRVLFNNSAFDENVPEDNGAIITDGLKGSQVKFPYIGRPNSPPHGPNP